jgi:hypothetical protein
LHEEIVLITWTRMRETKITKITTTKNSETNLYPVQVTSFGQSIAKSKMQDSFLRRICTKATPLTGQLDLS